MRQDKINIIVGIIILLTPFSGFPREIKTIILSIGALIVIALALQEIRKEHKRKAQDTILPDAYVESKPSKTSGELIEEELSRRQEFKSKQTQNFSTSHVTQNSSPVLPRKPRIYNKRTPKEVSLERPPQEINNEDNIVNE